MRVLGGRAQVQQLLQQMQARFQDMSEQILSRINDMGARIDDLEKSISELMASTGMDDDEAKKDKKDGQKEQPE